MLLVCCSGCRYLKMVTKRHHITAVELCRLAAETSVHIEKLHPGSKIVEGVSDLTLCSHRN
jgi:hypothetical protein